MKISNMDIAHMCHENIRAWSLNRGLPNPVVAWEDASQDIKDSALAGVEYVIKNINVTDEALHEQWMKDKEAAGWVYGTVKDSVAKTHPSLVPYKDLTPEERMKDKIFRTIVLMMIGSI